MIEEAPIHLKAVVGRGRELDWLGQRHDRNVAARTGAACSRQMGEAETLDAVHAPFVTAVRGDGIVAAGKWCFLRAERDHAERKRRARKCVAAICRADERIDLAREVGGLRGAHRESRHRERNRKSHEAPISAQQKCFPRSIDSWFCNRTGPCLKTAASNTSSARSTNS